MHLLSNVHLQMTITCLEFIYLQNPNKSKGLDNNRDNMQVTMNIFETYVMVVGIGSIITHPE